MHHSMLKLNFSSHLPARLMSECCCPEFEVSQTWQEFSGLGEGYDQRPHYISFYSGSVLFQFDKLLFRKS